MHHMVASTQNRVQQLVMCISPVAFASSWHDAFAILVCNACCRTSCAGIAVVHGPNAVVHGPNTVVHGPNAPC